MEKNHKEAFSHLETELPARLEAPRSLNVSSPTWKSYCLVFFSSLNIFDTTSSSSSGWRVGGRDISANNRYLNHQEGCSACTKVGPFIWTGSHKYYPTTLLAITETLALVAAHVENSPMT